MFRWLMTFSIITLLSACSPATPGLGRETSALNRYEKSMARSNTGKALPRDASLGQLLDFAVMRSPVLRAQYHLVMAQRARVGFAGPLPNPKVSYSWYAIPVETRDGPQRHRVTVSQQIPWPGKRTTARNAEALWVRTQVARLESLKSALLFEVKRSYFRLWYTGRRIRLEEDYLKTLRLMEQVAAGRLAAAKGGVLRVLRTRLERQLVRTGISRLREQGAVERARLAGALGVDRVHIAWPKALPLTREQLVKARLREQLLAASPLLNEETRRLMAQQAKVAQAKTAGLPDFSVGVAYIETGTTDLPGAVSSGRDPIMITFGISVPLWRSRERARVTEGQARVDYLRSRREALRIKLSSAFNTAWERLMSTRAQLVAYDSRVIPVARAAMKSALATFSAQGGTLQAALDVARTLYRLERARLSLLLSEGILVAELERLTGIPLFAQTTTNRAHGAKGGAR